MPRTPLVVAALGAASILVLAGCAPTNAGDGSAAGDGVTVVASTNVYGQLAETIGGDAVDVVSIIDSPTQDPHSYEPSARDQLTVSRADLVIENGGGYDPFVDALIEATGTTAPILTAVEFSPHWTGGSAHDDSAGDAHDGAADAHDGETDAHGHAHTAGFNEHVWYDLHTIDALAVAIAAELEALRPADAETFQANLAALQEGLGELEAEVSAIADAHGGARIFVTEPIPLWLTDEAGLVDATPAAFSQAVEEGQDVAPATLLEALDLVRGGAVDLMIVNAQTGGAETEAVIAAAEDAGIPVLEFTETIPDGVTYVEWMQDNISALADGLGG